MAPAPEPNTTTSSADFGANDWLIEEMLDRFRTDPTSVDGSWQAFFTERGETPAPTPAPVARPAAATPTPPPPAAPKHPATAPSTPAAASAPAVTAAAAAPKSPRVERPNEVRSGPRPVRAGQDSGVPADPPNPSLRPEAGSDQPVRTVMKGAPMRTAKNMDLSLSVPTATSVRTIPMKLLIDQRSMINNHLRRARGGKISFTHLIAYALVQAVKDVPAMNNSYDVTGGKPTLVENPHVNVGLAIDVPKPDGTRQLLVPNIKAAETLTFAQFWSAYEELVQKGRGNKLTVDDFAGTTVSLTNPGPMGTHHSVPRLMNGQAAIIGMGSIAYPPEFEGSDPERLEELGIGKICTLTSTYDHRVIQGAQSGEFLNRMHDLLLGADDFYEKVFASLRIPYAPYKWTPDKGHQHEDAISKQTRVMDLVNAYRVSGHYLADIDPLEYHQRSFPDLELESHGLSVWDLDRSFAVGGLGPDQKRFMKLRDIIITMRDAYSRAVGIEYMHLGSPEQRRWIQDRVERRYTQIPGEEHLRILDKLNEAELFETFLQTKYVGQKRFSLEGGESAIVALDEICDQAAQDGLDEVAIGMPHRGRLNVLTNIVGKSYGSVFREFDGNLDPRSVQGSGDVKYHLGAEGTFTAMDGSTIRASVAANPSHLEAVDPVLEGIARAKQDMLNRSYEFPVLPVLLHGDASFAGQGVIAETFQMSQLRGFRTGGTIHIIVNNQIGFTTSPDSSRSTFYSSGMAKGYDVPIIHVNGDDPEAVVRASRFAYEFRREFNKDVVLDIVCYRRRGHNEGDDPSFTQPTMYRMIENKRSARKLYAESLIGRGLISIEDAEAVMDRFHERLESVFKEVREDKGTDTAYTTTPDYPEKSEFVQGTAVSPEVLKRVADAYVDYPEGFTPHRKVRPQLERRAAAIMQGPIDWATAELLAIGSVLMDGRTVRMTGQDTRRGTFSQRFAAVIDSDNGDAWVPLKHLTEDQGKFHVFNSLLSEYAVMGFEYGYSVARPDALVMWEAQFGDFADGAQTISDEFIASGNTKWGQKSGVVLLLPHGYEGQGADHSSARIERWLQMCAEDNMAVCQPSTPANYFHLLRQHALVGWHRPLIVPTPKSMLRNKLATSMPEDFTTGRWQHSLSDPSITDPSQVERVLICSGKVRWELVHARDKKGLNGKVAIVTLERLYPLSTDALLEVLAPYRHVTDIRWVQDEPANQGPWPFLHYSLLPDLAAKDPSRDWSAMPAICRPASATTAVGSKKRHDAEEQELMDAAFGPRG